MRKTGVELNASSATALSLKLLTLRGRSAKELFVKLRKKGYSEEVIQETVKKLTDYGYLNDEDFAKSFASSRARNKRWGSVKIRAELRAKGIDKDVITEAVRNIDETQTAEAALGAWLKKHALRRNKDKDTGIKAFRFLASRGFPPGIAADTVKKLVNNKVTLPDEE